MTESLQFTRRKFIKASALTAAEFGARVGLPSSATAEDRNPIYIVNEGQLTPKITHGMGYLTGALSDVGIPYRVEGNISGLAERHEIRIGVAPAALPPDSRHPEAFTIRSDGPQTRIRGFDDAGLLYGCSELASRIKETKGIPVEIDVADFPKMAMRGTALFLMTAGMYIYPISERQFPWFYDKDQWLRTLDFLAENRLNFISFWNAHPFPYFVRLKQYPELNVLSGTELHQNERLLDWLSAEADRRNIWLMFQFYNIYVPENVAKAHAGNGSGKDVVFSNGYAVLSEPTPWAASYTRSVISEFVRRYPSIGLYVCLGEALQKNQSSWMDEVILGGVKDSGKKPPVILRNWALKDDLEILKKAAASYGNLHTEMKHNDEMYAVTEPDPANIPWIEHSPSHIISVHLMGNLKPFRWAPPSFIQETAKNQQKMGARGIQAYPLWPWDWPYSADRQKLLQIERDWLWYAAWGRYAWNGDRDGDKERRYWTDKIAAKYGRAAAPDILDAYESTGRVMPNVPRMFWFDGWNHWFASNTLELSQILEGTPIPYTNIKKTMSVKEFATKLAKGITPDSDVVTPGTLMDRMVRHGTIGVQSVHKAAAHVQENTEEFNRLRADVEATALIARIYLARMNAAVHFVANQLKPATSESAAVKRFLEESVTLYRKLVRTMGDMYPAVNDMANDIPFPFNPLSGDPRSANSIPHLPNWQDLLTVFESELETYRGLLH